MNKNIIIVVLVLALVGLGGYTFWQNANLKAKQNSSLSQIVPEQKEVSPAPVPEKNTVYVGEHAGKTVVFSANPKLQDTVYEGTALDVVGKVDFRNLLNPKKVYTFSEDSVEGPTSFTFSDAKDILYFTLNHHVYDGIGKPYAEIVEIDLNKNSNRIVWTSDGLTTKPEGPAFLGKLYDGTYLSFVRAGCFACGGGAGTLSILNVKTGKFVQAGNSDVGNIQVDIPAGHFSYQKNVTVCSLNNSCTGEPYPETKPYGKVFTEKLP